MIAALDPSTAGPIGLLIAFGAFAVVVVDVYVVRRRADLQHDLHLPLDEAPQVTPAEGAGNEKGAHSDGAR